MVVRDECRRGRTGIPGFPGSAIRTPIGVRIERGSATVMRDLKRAADDRAAAETSAQVVAVEEADQATAAAE